MRFLAKLRKDKAEMGMGKIEKRFLAALEEEMALMGIKQIEMRSLAALGMTGRLVALGAKKQRVERDLTIIYCND